MKLFHLYITWTLLLLLINSIHTSAQSPAAAPAPPGPTNVTAVLEKAGRFTTFIRLLKSTKVADQINTQLNDSNQGLTIFAPSDAAFSSLKTGSLNSYSDEQKTQLMQFHVLPVLYSPSQFETASNPVRTQAGGGQELFAMNVTAGGDGRVNITTGYTNASVGSTVYADDQLAVYDVDSVLLPRRFFEALPPSPPPPPPPEKADKSPKDSTEVGSVQANASGGVCMYKQVVVAMAAAFLQVLW